MATGGTYWALPGVIATGDLSSYQYYVAIAASTASCVKIGATKATDPILGILQNDPTSGQAAEVAFMGVCLAKAEASVTYGDKLTVSSTGRVKTKAADADEIVGIALKASSSAGDLIPIMLARFEAAA